MDNDLWMRNYVRLTNFLKNNGKYPNINAKDEKERALAEFVRIQRHEYQNKTIERYREKLLNHIQFYWGYDKVKNDDSLESWQEYEQSYIQKLIKSNGTRFKKDGIYETNKVKDWELMQRKLEKNGALDTDREYELNKIGFYFDDNTTPKQQKKAIWFKNYNLLIKLLTFADGDYNKVKTLTKFKDIENWFYLQIKEEQNGALEDDRLYLLNNINFPFESIYEKD